MLLAEVDDIVAPDPEKFSGGLRELLLTFAADVNSSHFAPYLATHGMQLAHISEGSHEIEPALNWTDSLLTQRRYWGWDGLPLDIRMRTWAWA